MAPHPIPLPGALAFPPPSHRDAITPSPCWAHHFMTQERIMFANPTPSEPRLSPAATIAMSRHRLSLRPCTAPLSCSLQPLLKLSLLSLRPSLLQFVRIVSPHSPSLRFGLPAPQPSRRHHAPHSPCWAPHFMTQERIMFSNPTPSRPRLSPAATIDATTSFLTPPLHCASIL